MAYDNSNNEPAYDLAAPSFDFLELRSYRRESILQYSLTYRTEQLRILFFGSSALVGLFFPYINGELFQAESGVVTYAASALSFLAFGYATLNSKAARAKKLLRLDQEYALGELSIFKAMGGKATLAELRGRRRVVAICAPPKQMRAALKSAAVYRRRLSQSGVLLVGVLSSGGGNDDDAKEREAAEAEMAAAELAGWLCKPIDAPRWTTYFSQLLTTDRARQSASIDGAWLALSLKGRSCGSGLGVLPWDELLGTQLPPLKATSPSEPPQAGNDAERSVLAAQQRLYTALTSADAAAVASLCAPADDVEVTQLAENGRLDGWSTVLKYDATVGMQVSSQDACVSADGMEAYSTGLEFPANGNGASLLCTQRWVRAEDDDDGDGWRLAQHRTIPYTENVDAAACLRCDRRGCVALERSGPRGAAGMPGDGRA